MKTILILGVALFFSRVAFAQSDVQPDFPYVTYNYEMMAPDCNDPLPWSVYVSHCGKTDAMPAIGWAIVNQKVPTPPVAIPNFPTASRVEGMMSPDGILPSIATPHRGKMFPY